MLTFNAIFKSIAHISWETDTCRNMVDDSAGGMLTTCARTRVNTLVIRAGKISVTVSVEDTLRPTSLVWITQEASRTGAGAASLTRSGYSTWPTEVKLTSVVFFFI